VGHIPINVKELGVDLLSFAGHRFYGPKGVGAIYVRDGIKIHPLIQGGIQEEGRRAGTENVSGIIGLGVAAQIAMAEMAENAAKTKRLRDKLEGELQERVDHIYINGHPTKRLPHFLNLCVEYIEGESLLMHLNHQGILAASGSPCTSVVAKASHVLQAIGVDEVLARGVILFSLGRGNTEEDVQKVLDVFLPAVKRLREMSPLVGK
jgi:cysteine desulfurase